MHGSFKSYFENGILKTSKFYKNGKSVGIIKHFYKNGSIWIKIENQNDKKQHWTFYHKNGTVKSEGYKLNDENIGIWKEYSDHGELMKETEY